MGSNMKRASVLLAVLCVATSGVAVAASRPVQAADCVQIKYPVYYDNNNAVYGTIKISPDGHKVAYLLKAPNIAKDDNTFELYVRDISERGRENGSLISTGVKSSHIEWIESGKSIAMLTARGLVSLVAINVATRDEVKLFRTDKNIVEYAISSDGTAVAFTTEASHSDSKDEIPHDPGEVARGYPIIDHLSETESRAKTNVYISHRKVNDEWTTPVQLRFHDPFSQADLSEFATYRDGYTQRLSLSPDGRYLLFSYIPDHVPTEWEEHPYVKAFREAGSPLMITVLYEMRSGVAVVPLNTVTALSSVPVWSSDGLLYAVHAPSPFGSTWEKEDLSAHHLAPSETNTFEVNVVTRKIEEVFRDAEHDEAPLFVQTNGDVLIHASSTVVNRYSRDEKGWRIVETIHLPSPAQDHIFPMVSDGKQVIGVLQAPTVPPDLFIYQPDSNTIRMLTKLNPQLESLDFATVRTIQWRTADGVDITGQLFQPSGYIPGRRYPLVIQTKGLGSSFACDSGGATHDPAFAPQPIASAGMFYLARGGAPTEAAMSPQIEAEHFPKQYPGKLGEAAHAMDIWDSAVRYLDSQGLIDPARVGIIGFSRTGWHVEFGLFMSKLHFAAATVSDNVQYSLGEYFLLARQFGTSDGDYMYGGPPYGETFKNWMTYSVSFNLDKIHTPLLMESMGYGARDDTQYKIPLPLAVPSETFVGLNRLHKPVEWYFYPDGEHQPESPVTRLFSLQRNVDWYRFWLQDYERPNPEDPSQYKRWEHLRELRNSDYNAAGIPTPK